MYAAVDRSDEAKPRVDVTCRMLAAISFCPSVAISACPRTATWSRSALDISGGPALLAASSTRANRLERITRSARIRAVTRRCVFLLGAGLRIGEVVWLHWRNVDVERRLVRINEFATVINHEVIASIGKRRDVCRSCLQITPTWTRSVAGQCISSQ